MSPHLDLEHPPASRRPRRGRHAAAILGATTLAAGALVAVGAAPAQAGQCSSKTGGSSDTVMWTGKGYTCAYQSKSGKKKIGSFNTHTWMSNTASGYTKRDHRWKQTGGVKVSYVYVDGGGGGAGSSITFTAFNGEDGSRHWGAAVMWNTPKGGKIDSSQYKGDSYEYETSRFYVTKISADGPATANAGTPTSYTVKVTDPDGGSTPTGMVALMLQSGSKQNPPTTGCDSKTTAGDKGVAQAALSNGSATLTLPGMGAGTYNLYAVYAGSQTSKGLPLYCEKPTQNGLTGAQSGTWTLTVGSAAARSASALDGSTATADGAQTVSRAVGDVIRNKAKIKLVEHTFTTGAAGGAAGHRMVCGPGWAPLQINAASPTRVLPERLFTRAGGKLGIADGVAPKGTRVDVQMICRDRTAPKRTLGKLVLGSMHADALRTKKAGSTVLAGAGHDVVRVTEPGSVGFGHVGKDRIVVTTSRGAAHGGPGADYLEARRPGSVVLVGGLGKDTLVGSHRRSLINAVDGSGGDTIVCRSEANVVHADKGDRVQGSCDVHRHK